MSIHGNLDTLLLNRLLLERFLCKSLDHFFQQPPAMLPVLFLLSGGFPVLRLDFSLALALEKVSTQTPNDVKNKNFIAGIEVLYLVLRRIS